MRFKDAVHKLESAGKLKIHEGNFSTDLKISEMIKKEPSAILFDGSDPKFKIAANIMTRENVQALFGMDIKEVREKLLHALSHPIKPKMVEKHNFVEHEADLERLPILRHFSEDRGKYITTSIYFAEDEQYGRNMSYHRTLVHGKDRATLRLTHRDLWKYHQKKDENIPVAVCIGLEPILLLAGAITVDIDQDEAAIAGGFLGEPIEFVKLDNGISVPKDAEIVLVGTLTSEQDSEGPFVDMTGTYDFERQQPVLKITKIYTQPDPYYHALVSAYAEHNFLMGFPREPVIWNRVSKVCRVHDLALTNGGINWLHCAVSIVKKEKSDPKRVVDAVLDAHPSVKHVFVYDEDIDIHNPKDMEWALATRFQADKGLYLFPGSKGSSLDPSSEPGEDRRITCKAGFDCTIPWGKEKREFVRAK